MNMRIVVGMGIGMQREMMVMCVHTIVLRELESVEGEDEELKAKMEREQSRDPQ